MKTNFVERFSIEMKCKRHAQQMCVHQPYKSAVAEHSIIEGCCIIFKDVVVLARKVGYMYYSVKDVIEIKLHLDILSRRTE